MALCRLDKLTQTPTMLWTDTLVPPNHQMDEEIRYLKQKLHEAYQSLDSTHAQMKLQKLRTKQLIAAWKLRLEEGEGRLRNYRLQLDSNMQNILQQIMFFEGQLRKEQKDIQRALDEKDRLILDQKKKLKALVQKNSELARAVNDLQAELREQDMVIDTLTRSHGDPYYDPNASDGNRSLDQSKEPSPNPAVSDPGSSAFTFDDINADLKALRAELNNFQTYSRSYHSLDRSRSMSDFDLIRSPKFYNNFPAVPEETPDVFEETDRGTDRLFMSKSAPHLEIIGKSEDGDFQQNNLSTESDKTNLTHSEDNHKKSENHLMVKDALSNDTVNSTWSKVKASPPATSSVKTNRVIKRPRDVKKRHKLRAQSDTQLLRKDGDKPRKRIQTVAS